MHWTWFVVAAIEYQMAATHSQFHHPLWYLVAYLALFGIVTLHEFGHALACRSVGGQAEHIVLWPLGGIAFVRPPQRPGPVLWSIAAGPLVNVALVPVTIGLCYLFHIQPHLPSHGWTDPQLFIVGLTLINLGLLALNLLPIYPLDGGQILQAILWFFIGRSKSLWITTVIGLIGAVAGGVFALITHRWFILAIAAFVGYEAYDGFRVARDMVAAEAAANDRARHLAGVDRWET